MIKINRKLEYALMVLKFMKNKSDKDLTTAREICHELHIPFDPTAKVMQQLNTAGLLSSQKGVKGGYGLNIDLSEMSYLDLVEIIEGKSFILDCHQGPCELLKSCTIYSPIGRLNDYLMTILRDLRLSELLSDDNRLALKIHPQTEVPNCPVKVSSSKI